MDYSPTKFKDFDKTGFFIVENICNVTELIEEVPEERGYIRYLKPNDKEYKLGKQFVKEECDDQMKGCFSRYKNPRYKHFHTKLRLILEEIIGKKLYNTFYYDRFYFPGNELKRHVDRHACEISITLHIGSNLKQDWPISIESVDGEVYDVELNPGDALVYKGCDRPHWRDVMIGRESAYYHQAFFHYVLADGTRCQYAFDVCK